MVDRIELLLGGVARMEEFRFTHLGTAAENRAEQEAGEQQAVGREGTLHARIVAAVRLRPNADF